jgi:hypothetical protein
MIEQTEVTTPIKCVLFMPSQVQFATQAVFEKLPLQPHPTAQLSGFLFLQLTVSELGICLPLHNITQVCAMFVPCLWHNTKYFRNQVVEIITAFHG